jgi:KDO2-lipid IV(A) lauroyltransferase
MIVYCLVLCLISLTQRLPRRVGYWIANIVGDLVYVFWPSGRANVIDNMRHVLGPEATEKEIRATARRSFRNYVKLLVDFARNADTDRATVEGRLEPIGVDRLDQAFERLDQAFERGKGVLVVGSHLGDWEIAGIALANRGYPINAVSETLGNARINQMAIRSRAARGIQLIPMEYALRRVYVALHRNEAVGLVVDRPLSPDEGVPVKFFDERISWPTGPAVLALRTGATIVTGYLVRNERDHYLCEIFPPLEYDTTGDHDADVQRITQQLVTIQEDLIRRYPDQWFMFRRMWPSARGQA